MGHFQLINGQTIPFAFRAISHLNPLCTTKTPAKYEIYARYFDENDNNISIDHSGTCCTLNPRKSRFGELWHSTVLLPLAAADPGTSASDETNTSLQERVMNCKMWLTKWFYWPSAFSFASRPAPIRSMICHL